MAGSKRIHELDYLKGIFILLMVIFHLALVEETYPVLREAVYTFHMSAFLIISGYLANVEKTPQDFGKGLLRLLIPYVLFESLYILMQYFVGGSLGAHNAIGQLTPTDFIYRVATQPTGPYWYLHTLILCTAVYYVIYRLLKLKSISGLALTGLILFGLSLVIEGLNWDYVIYFLMGMFILQCGGKLTRVIAPSFWAILPLILLFSSRNNFQNGSLAGVAITVLVMSALLAFYPYCSAVVRNVLCYIGRNSLAIVIFSPIFTLATKLITPYFAFDPTAICFTIVALAFVVGCCLACAWLADKLHISQYIFAKDRFYTPSTSRKQPLNSVNRHNIRGTDTLSN